MSGAPPSPPWQLQLAGRALELLDGLDVLPKSSAAHLLGVPILDGITALLKWAAAWSVGAAMSLISWTTAEMGLC